jgi:hypothetical protein
MLDDDDDDDDEEEEEEEEEEDDDRGGASCVLIMVTGLIQAVPFNVAWQASMLALDSCVHISHSKTKT